MIKIHKRSLKKLKKDLNYIFKKVIIPIHVSQQQKYKQVHRAKSLARIPACNLYIQIMYHLFIPYILNMACRKQE